MNGIEKTEEITGAALALAKEVGYSHISRERIAKMVGCTPTLVSYYFKNTRRFKDAIMKAAVREKDVQVVAQGLALQDKIALAAPVELKQAAADYLATL